MEESKKKPRRGKRGGQKKAAVSTPASVERAGDGLRPDYEDNHDMDDAKIQPTFEASAVLHDEPTKKKTRRGKRGGAKAVEEKEADHDAAGGQNYDFGDDYVDEPRFPKLRRGEKEKKWKPYTDMQQPDFGVVPPDSVSYLENVETMLEKNEWETDEDFEIFIENVFAEIKELNVKVAGDPICSRILEKVMKFSSDAQLRDLAASFNNMYSDMFRHRFASHVVQTLITLAGEVVEREMNSMILDGQEKMEPFFSSLCEELNGQWGELMKDPWASHILRALLLTLTGRQKELEDVVRNSPSSYFDQMITDKVGSRLMEKVLMAATPDAYHEIFIQHFRSKIANLCFDNVGNFVVQRLIENAKNGMQFEVLMDEIIPHVEDLLFHSRAGVVVKCIETSGKYQVCEKSIFKAICKAFHVNESSQRQYLVQLLLRMTRYEDYETHKGPKYQYLGAQIIECLLGIKDDEISAGMLNSFLSISTSELMVWSADAVASRVIENFLKSPNVNLKAKRKIVTGFLDKIGELALGKYGSHLVDKCWDFSDIQLKVLQTRMNTHTHKKKEKIATELLKVESKLQQSFQGKFVLRNCKIESFKRSKESWTQNLIGAEKKKQMFKEFAEKTEEETNALLTTPKYDKTMELLGVASAAPKPKRQAKSKADDFTGKKLALESVPEDRSASAKKNEIDFLFKSVANKQSADGADYGVDVQDTIGMELASDPALAEVLDALTSTKRKKKSKDEDDGISKKEKAKKKRKFES
ncbi:Nucleolar protein 9 [Phlyctochytrium planicorne]|nr:Nucleolar protein 9 [Phlyctochytrium planicorne]